jgi:tubulin delta
LLADVSPLADRALYAPWAPEPLRVACQPARFGRCDMAAALLANASCGALPAQRMLPRAYSMFASRAYCHQYAAHGLEHVDFEAAFARVEDAVAAYDL